MPVFLLLSACKKEEAAPAIDYEAQKKAFDIELSRRIERVVPTKVNAKQIPSGIWQADVKYFADQIASKVEAKYGSHSKQKKEEIIAQLSKSSMMLSVDVEGNMQFITIAPNGKIGGYSGRFDTKLKPKGYTKVFPVRLRIKGMSSLGKKANATLKHVGNVGAKNEVLYFESHNGKMRFTRDPRPAKDIRKELFKKVRKAYPL